MGGFDEVAWLPLCAGLTMLGLAGSWLAFRRRGVAAGLRGAAWSLLPLVAYLTGVVTLLWKVGTAVTGWLAGFVFSPRVWAGVAVAGLAAGCFVVSGLLRRRAPAQPPPRPSIGPATRKEPAPSQRPGTGGDDDFSEIEEILRRRGIR